MSVAVPFPKRSYRCAARGFSYEQRQASPKSDNEVAARIHPARSACDVVANTAARGTRAIL